MAGSVRGSLPSLRGLEDVAKSPKELIISGMVLASHCCTAERLEHEIRGTVSELLVGAFEP